jgi:hypothetical protein
MRAGIAGLLRDKTRPSRIPSLPVSVRERAATLALDDPPGEATHWTAAASAASLLTNERMYCGAIGRTSWLTRCSSLMQ